MRILAIRGKNLASLAEPFEILLNAGPLGAGRIIRHYRTNRRR